MVNDAHTTGPGPSVPVVVGRVRADLARLVDAPVWSMSTAECRDVLVELTRVQAQVVELEARVLAHAETTGAAVETGAASTPAWLAHATRATSLDVHRRTRLATALDRHQTVREGMAAGHVLAEQATVICAAVDALPEEPTTRERCEKHLVALAARPTTTVGRAGRAPGRVRRRDPYRALLPDPPGLDDAR